jgi:hypothetical protein
VEAAGRREALHDVGGDRALVEAAAAVARDAPERGRSPRPSTRPCGAKIFAAAESVIGLAPVSAKSDATRGVRAQPSSASRMAGARSSAMSLVPWSATSRHHASTAPGTVTACGDSGRITAMRRSRYHSAVAFCGARPEPLSATGLAPFFT